jgi:hypothetical protein
MTEREKLLERLRQLIKNISSWSEWPTEANIGAVLTDIEKYLSQTEREPE